MLELIIQKEGNKYSTYVGFNSFKDILTHNTIMSDLEFDGVLIESEYFENALNKAISENRLGQFIKNKSNVKILYMPKELKEQMKMEELLIKINNKK